MEQERIAPADDNPLLPSIIKAEVNLSRLPFFALVHKELENFKVELMITETRGGERLELFWGITPNVKYGYPGWFAKRVHRAIEYLLTKNGFPVPESLDFSFYEIMTLLGVEPSGRTRAQMKAAILSIASTTIESKGTFCYLDSGEKRWVEDYFHLYERVVFAGRQLPDGTIAEKNRIYFNQWYLRSLNSFYLKPLDFKYWRDLKKNLSGRLYEYLSVVAFATKCKPFRIDYHKLCEFLPSTPQPYISLAKRVLSRAHQELIETGFLKKVVWQKSKQDSKKWILTYSFGTRAESELKRGFSDETYRPALLAVETAEGSEVEGQGAIGERDARDGGESEDGKGQKVKSTRKPKGAPETKELSVIAQQLVDRGITFSVAIALAESFPQEYLQEKMALHDGMKAAGELTQNAAGWLRSAIEEDYQVSQEQRKQMQVQAKRKAQEADQQALRERAEALREQRIQEAMKYFPTQEEWIRQHVEMRQQIRALMVERFGQTPLTDEDIQETHRSARKNYPKTDGEKLAYICRHPQDYKADLKDIIEELKVEDSRNGVEDSRDGAEHPVRTHDVN